MNGVKFNELHSYDNLNLILAPFVPTPATVKTVYIDIAGGNGTLDLTEAHGEVKYNDREFAFTFTVKPSESKTFDEKVTEISNALNGKKCKITLDRDAAYYWEGRCFVDQYLQDRNLKQIVIKATVKPYKLKQQETTVSFDLSSTEKEVIVMNGRKSAIPRIICTDDNTNVTFGATTYTLNAGEYRTLDICFVEGENHLKLSGAGTITFVYQEGDL